MLLLFCIPLILYSISLTFGFVYDDIPLIFNNPWITDFRHIPDILSSSAWAFEKEDSNYYRPLFMLALMAEHYVFGFKAWGFHLVSMILHSLNAVMVFLVVSLLFSRNAVRAKADSASSLKTIHVSAFLAGLVFALHTINTESVVWISAVSELLFTLLLLISFYLYIKAEDGPKRALPISVLCFFLALLTKETAIVLVLLIPAYEFSNHGRALCKRWRAYLPYLVTAAVYMAIRTSIVGGVVHHKVIDLSAWESLLNVFPLIARYFAKLMIPLGLSIVYPIPPIHSIGAPAAIIGVAAALFFLCALLFFRKNSFVFFGLLWIFIPLLPAMYVPAISLSSMADRYLYLSTVGFAMLAAYLAGFLFLRAKPAGYGRLAVALVTAIILIGYSAGTVMSSLVWKDDSTLWTNAVRKFPESAITRLMLADTLKKMGRTDSALTHYRATLRIKPDYKDAHYNVADLYQQRGNHANAIIHYKEILRIDPRHFTAHYRLAISYRRMGDTAGAIASYKEVLRIKPDHKDSLYNLALLYQYVGDNKNAIARYKTLIRLNPGDKEAHYNMGFIYAGEGLLDNAAVEFEAALAIDPSHGKARFQLDRVMRLRGSRK